ncbi:hypothetical protein CNMCM8980_009661 [Aspergillus fumigatiaffinis]|nr:hypothetical protein CNMCM8980_009661 [Aspergillus fumigatiaffinis]
MPRVLPAPTRPRGGGVHRRRPAPPVGRGGSPALPYRCSAAGWRARSGPAWAASSGAGTGWWWWRWAARAAGPVAARWGRPPPSTDSSGCSRTSVGRPPARGPPSGLWDGAGGGAPGPAGHCC